ncbi:helix-turn-helix domain-containing protein [Providencia vermicola]|uniref:helix-turn-helix domain-containing protein n=1 Tax=Providencia vermicola TaxID=333965 RepID=UPI001CEC4AD3|nr:helix-turn-helix domain-containing protein [Providencia vermicola]
MMENKVKQLRLARAWSQEQLAQLSSLSTRTIQRIENNEVPSLETLSALASVFNVSVSELTSEPLLESYELDSRIEEAKKRVSDEAKLLKNIIIAIIVCAVLYAVNSFYTPQRDWPIWVMSIWGGLLAIKAIRLFLLDKFFRQWQHKRLLRITKKP